MGTELARHLLADHELTVWNRTPERAQPLVEEGATLASSPAAAVAEAELIISCLFGPDDVREVITTPGLIPTGVTWIDTTTISPADARSFAQACDSFVHAPVIGTLGPARAGQLGTYVGTPDAQRRAEAMGIVSAWAAPEKLKGVESAAAAATGKLLANLALSVTAEGVLEALALGEAEGFDAAAVLDMLHITGLSFMAGLKAPFILGERSTEPGDFTVDALCKDSHLMTSTVRAAGGPALPAVEAAIARFEAEQDAGRGNTDFSSIFVHRPRLGTSEEN